MPTTRKRKTRKRTAAPAGRNRKVIRARASRPIDVAESEGASCLEMRGGRLTVRISRESHPEVFEIDRLLKQVRKVIDRQTRNRKMRDFREFLEETEKSLQIILSNHLEDALRKYLH